jgi:hypothetical protein
MRLVYRQEKRAPHAGLILSVIRFPSQNDVWV